MGNFFTAPDGKYADKGFQSYLGEHRTGYHSAAKFRGQGQGHHRGNRGQGHHPSHRDDRGQLDARRDGNPRTQPMVFDTKSLLLYWETSCKNVLQTINNIRKEKDFDRDPGIKVYIHSVMKEAEEDLQKYNKTVMTMEGAHPRTEEEAKQLQEMKEQLQKVNLPGIHGHRVDDHNPQKDGLKVDIESQTYEISQLQAHLDVLQQENQRLRSKEDIPNTKLEIDKKRLEDEVMTLRDVNKVKTKEIKRLEEEMKALQLRLSKIASEKLSDNNPAIADLSDPNRPTKLGEAYCQLYDDDWTDAFEALEKAGKTEKEAIDILKRTLWNTSEFCKRKAQLFLDETDKTIKKLFDKGKELSMIGGRHMTMAVRMKAGPSGDITMQELLLYSEWAKTTDFEQSNNPGYNPNLSKSQREKYTRIIETTRKELAFTLVPLVQKAYLSRAGWGYTCIPQLKPFIKKCVQISWLMVVHRPPLCFVKEDEKSSAFVKEIYKPYTQSGANLDYVVWPPMLLHEGGAMLAKGVAQFKKE